MATPQVSINPSLTSNAAGLFSISETGLVQGVAMDDPAVRFALAQGSLKPTETLPMWGGVAIFENIPLATADSSLGGEVGRAASLATITGFSVFNQAFNGLTSPQSNVPLQGTSNTINFYRLGSGARIGVAVDPALVSIDGSAITTQVSWDYTSQRLVKYAPTYTANTITGAVWSNTAGGQTVFTVSTDPTAYATAGVTIDVSGVVSTGGTGVGFNGAFIVVSSTSTTITVTQAAASSPGTYSSGGTVLAGGGALPVKVLKILPSNCKTVVYDAANNFANWNNNGACALIQI